MIKIEHKTWQSTAGYTQEHWEVFRDGFQIGTISHCAYSPNWSNSMKYQAMPSNSYKTKYFVKFDNAVKWLERTMKNIIPITDINKYLV